ncbi:hypothetical protein [Sphaerotilus sp.]|uniref:hypothetical protein n=1 Tax=Sphaerotilus sp. TaxID=2093942 RepID=UPI00286E9E74|nr:hypothetical protein [Sphaerotilus sp.]
MFAMRQIIEDPQDEIVLTVPPEFRHRRTEVIFIAVDDVVDPAPARLAGLPKDRGIARFCGAIPDMPDRQASLTS